MRRRTLLTLSSAAAAATLTGCVPAGAGVAPHGPRTGSRAHPPTPINKLVLKSTHNSYDPRRSVPPSVQIEQYGVWAIELDCLVPAPRLRETHDAWNTNPPPLVVGHDGPGEAADDAGKVFGGPDFLLVNYLKAAAATEALKYRPLILFLEYKRPEGQFDPDYHEPQRMAERVGATLRAAFGDRIFGPKDVTIGKDWPPVADLAGKVVAISIVPPGEPEVHSDLIFRDHLEHVPDGTDPRRVSPLKVEAIAVNDGCGPIRGSGDPDYAIFRSDVFSTDDSFAASAPPNPIIVGAKPPPQVSGTGLGLATPICGHPDHPQGTRLFPYPTIAEAVARARGTGSLRTAGHGFTVLVAPGHPEEKIPELDFPLTVKWQTFTGKTRR